MVVVVVDVDTRRDRAVARPVHAEAVHELACSVVGGRVARLGVDGGAVHVERAAADGVLSDQHGPAQRLGHELEHARQVIEAVLVLAVVRRRAVGEAGGGGAYEGERVSG